jgi:hypothetical protein
MKDINEARLDQLYKLIVVGQRARAHGLHYKCTFESAAALVKVILGERPDLAPLFDEEHRFTPERLIARNITYNDLFLRIKTQRGWVSGFERKKNKTK